MTAITHIERVRLWVRELASATDEYRALFGFDPVDATDAVLAADPEEVPARALFRLENTSFELIEKPDLAAPKADRFEIVFAADSLVELAASLSQELLPRGETAVPPELPLELSGKVTGGVRLTIVEAPPSAVGSTLPRQATDSLFGLDHLVVRTRDADACRQTYEQGLGLRIALDREFPDWSTRLIFCRVGSVTLEIAQRLRDATGATGLEEDVPACRDAVYGFTWQTRDIDATQERLESAGLSVSATRAGRRPGTRVCTVRSGTQGVPTLIIEPADRPVGT